MSHFALVPCDLCALDPQLNLLCKENNSSITARKPCQTIVCLSLHGKRERKRSEYSKVYSSIKLPPMDAFSNKYQWVETRRLLFHPFAKQLLVDAHWRPRSELSPGWPASIHQHGNPATSGTLFISHQFLRLLSPDTLTMIWPLSTNPGIPRGRRVPLHCLSPTSDWKCGMYRPKTMGMVW